MSFDVRKKGGSVIIRKKFDESDRELLVCVGESRTQQSFKEECDVNVIMRKYEKTGLITHVSKVQGQYGDFSSIGDYQEALDKLSVAQDAFLDMPAKLRARFGNDPGQLIEFINNKENYEEAVKLGLIVEAVKEPSLKEDMMSALAENDKLRAAKSAKKEN